MKRICLAALGAVLCSATSFADHSWATYHWARTTNSFDLTIVNSTTPDWDGYVTQAIGDWSQSTKLNMIDVASDDSSKTRRRCQGPDGQVRICNLAYGNTGWLGIAGISIDSAGHITTGYTKLNDTYFSDPFYDETWKQSVTCQELGHNVGLDHQDENFNNGSLFTCMDYQNPPYEFPNDHDFVQLETIYGHTDEAAVTGLSLQWWRRRLQWPRPGLRQRRHCRFRGRDRLGHLARPSRPARDFPEGRSRWHAPPDARHLGDRFLSLSFVFRRDDGAR